MKKNKEKKVCSYSVDSENKQPDLILEEKTTNKFRTWIILLYPDSKVYNFDEVLRICKSQRDYAFIKHLPESNERKEHFHVILRFENATKKETLARKLGIGTNYIDEVKAFRTMCRYLTHIDDEDKFQYSVEQVKVSKCFQRDYYKTFDDIESEEEIINKIYSFISKVGKLPYNEAVISLITYVNINCYDRIYKRYRYEFNEYLKSTCVL